MTSLMRRSTLSRCACTSAPNQRRDRLLAVLREREDRQAICLRQCVAKLLLVPISELGIYRHTTLTQKDKLLLYSRLLDLLFHTI